MVFFCQPLFGCSAAALLSLSVTWLIYYGASILDAIPDMSLYERIRSVDNGDSPVCLGQLLLLELLSFCRSSHRTEANRDYVEKEIKGSGDQLKGVYQFS